ncbi:MAG: CAAX prenyl protease-related protein [Pirellulales bacterium]
MSEPISPMPNASPKASPCSRCGCTSLVAKHRWMVFVVPFVVYMLMNSLEPAPPTDRSLDTPAKAASERPWLDLGIEYRHYPLVYTVKIVLTLAAMLLVWPGYREFPFRMSPLALLVGAVGVVAWVGICWLQLEQKWFPSIGLGWVVESGRRAGFNPLVQLADHPAWAYGFLAIRLFGLTVVVAVVEEFFLRGFLMRFFLRNDWWNVPFGTLNAMAIAVATVVPVALHPAEMLAAVVWFSMITWLMSRTRNIWDCVAAHAVTNLLLGIYVITSGQWQLM